MFEQLFCRASLQREKELKEAYEINMAKNTLLETQNTNKISKIQELTTILDKRNTRIEQLSAQLGGIKPVDIPSADITYRRPVLVGKNKYKDVEIDVRCFINPDFTIYHDIKKHDLFYDGNLDSLDTLIPALYHLARKNYKYIRDINFGFAEYWRFPFETREMLKRKSGNDCEDYAILIGSYFAAAGIPSDHWLISAGITRSGFGHGTVYAKDKLDLWRHLNSTSPSYSYEDLIDYPSNKDPNDKVGIKEGGFWFSFNRDFSLHKFETREATTSFSKLKNIKIKGEKGA